ncbi:MAG: hypothetical protein AAF614_16180 [Chloroflexota bacterium]
MKKILNQLKGLLGGQKKEAQAAETIVVPDIALKQQAARHRQNEVDEEMGEGKTAVIDPIFLRQQLSNHLTVTDLQAIAQMVGTDYDTMAGGKGRRVLELVTHCERKQMLEKLLDECQRRKPEVNWQL